MKTIHCGLIGHPVAHSRSPEIHLAFAEQTGVALDYALIDAAPDEFAERTRAFFASGGRGLNVTLPHKAAAFALADEAGDEARRSGVANVLTGLAGGSLRADNTDGIGLLRDLAHNLCFDPADRRLLIAGAGGAAAAIVPALLDGRVREIVIVNRTPARARELAARLDDRRLVFLQPDELANANAFDLIVNATSASLRGECPELPESAVGNETLAYDLVYSGSPTPFLIWAAALDARSADGRGMLAEQAAETFFLWHGIRPPTATLRGFPPPGRSDTD